MLSAFLPSFISPGPFASVEMKNMSSINKKNSKLTWPRRIHSWNNATKKPSCSLSEARSDPIVAVRPFSNDENGTIINGHICHNPRGESLNIKLPSKW